MKNIVTWLVLVGLGGPLTLIGAGIYVAISKVNSSASDASASKVHDIASGLYARMDSEAEGAQITSYNMSVGETGVRFLCGDGFKGYDIPGGFVVTIAPEGYSDTIGRKFKNGQLKLSNWAD